MSRNATRSGRKRRSLLPKEHGAWVQLLLPLLTALALGHPGVSALALTVGALAVFFAHEPVLVLLGHRGRRARDEERPRAKRLVFAMLGLAAVAGGVGLATSPWTVWPALLPVVVPAAFVVPLVRDRKERSTRGEVLAGLALSGASLPVGLAAGVALPVILTAWGLWAAVVVVETLAARGVLAMAKKRNPDPTLRRVSLGLGLLIQAGLAVLAVAGVVDVEVAVAFAPALLLAAAVNVLPVHAKQLMTVGILMLVGGLVTGGALLVGLA
ncbi:MAG: YwiC-like family protein [Myxococcota bacterium]